MCRSFPGTPQRLAAESEQLIVHKFPAGVMGLALKADVQRRERIRREAHQDVWWQKLRRCFQTIPGDAHPITAISCTNWGVHHPESNSRTSATEVRLLEEEEGAVFLHNDGEGYDIPMLRFNNGVEIRLQELRAGYCQLRCSHSRERT